MTTHQASEPKSLGLTESLVERDLVLNASFILPSCMSLGEVLTSSLDLILLISDVGIMVPRVGVNIKFF